MQSYSVQTIPDVKRNGYCFSDGVGRISRALCEAAAARLIRLGHCPPGCVPSALQIRFAGCKGMIALHPDLSGMQCVHPPTFLCHLAFSREIQQGSCMQCCLCRTSSIGGTSGSHSFSAFSTAGCRLEISDSGHVKKQVQLWLCMIYRNLCRSWNTHYMCVGTAVQLFELCECALCRLEVRPSMNKFEAESKMLEVCCVASYVPGYLNRQIITILMEKCLGVPDAVFQQLQARRITFSP